MGAKNQAVSGPDSEEFLGKSALLGRYLHSSVLQSRHALHHLPCGYRASNSFMACMRKLLLILAVEIAMAIGCLSQQIPLDQIGRSTRWDGTHKVLFFGAGIIKTPIRAYANGIRRGSDIDIFKDFPGIKQVIVDDISAGPNGSTV